MQAIVDGTIHTGKTTITGSNIIIEKGLVQSVQKDIPPGCEKIGLKGNNISAGFIDIHLNGGEQSHFSQHPTEETIDDMYQSSLKFGTTHLLPCLISSSHENILKGIEAIKNYRTKYQNGVLGMHPIA